jgi:two-component system response regulator CssR
MDYLIYLVEDDQNLNDILSSYLEKEGWKVKKFFSGLDAQDKIKEKPQLWILDIMLPGVDGYQLISEIKEEDSETPVIFISARDADLDRITGLEKGSDDYLAKPFSPRELVIRVRNLLNRIYAEAEKEKYNYADYIINLSSRQVSKKESGKIIDLTSKEFSLLLYLLNNLNNALSREQIITSVWGNDYYGSDRVVDDLVRRLRRKMEELKIETIYGHGYRLVR